MTSNCWIACTNIGYISLSAHYINKNWKLKSKILSFTHMQPPHTGHNLALKVLEFLRDWGEKIIFSITLDNASSNDNMQNMLKKHLCLSNSLLLNGEFFHIRCSTHILNLIVQDGLRLLLVHCLKLGKWCNMQGHQRVGRNNFFNVLNKLAGFIHQLA